MPVAAGIAYSLSGGDQGSGLPGKEIGQPVVILIHGAGSSHLAWPAELRRLPGWQILAIDLPGHGRSGGPGQQSIRGYADQVVQFLAHIGIYHAVLVGHSMGGAIALHIALEHPALVKGLGLISSSASLEVPLDMLQSFGNPSMLAEGLRRFQQLAFGPSASPALIQRCMQPLRKVRPSVLYGDWLACSTFDVRTSISQIACPIWAAVGSEDQLISLQAVNFVTASLPGSRLQVIKGAGHMVLLEQPAALTDGLNDYLSRLSYAKI